MRWKESRIMNSTVVLMFVASIAVIGVMVVMGSSRDEVGTVSAFALAAIAVAIGNARS
jgi:hypothetical protein